MIGLEIGGLVGDQTVGGAMAFVESVLGEFFQKVKDGIGLLRGDLVYPGAAFDKNFALFCHFLHVLFTHCPPEKIGLSEGIACQFAGGLLDLFLIDDDAVGFGADAFQKRMGVLDFFSAFFAIHVVVDKLHRAGTIEGNKRDDVCEMLDLKALCRRSHSAGLQLEDPDRFPPVEQVEGGCIIHRDGGNLEVWGVPVNEFHGIIDDGECLQSQKVHFEQSQVGEW